LALIGSSGGIARHDDVVLVRRVVAVDLVLLIVLAALLGLVVVVDLLVLERGLVAGAGLAKVFSGNWAVIHTQDRCRHHRSRTS
jgi:hypothetical protein